MENNTSIYKLANIAILLIIIGALAVCQYFYDDSKSAVAKTRPLIPDVSAVKAVNLGLDSATASVYWLAAIQYFGGYRSDNYHDLDEYIKLTTDLDPKFSHPYAFATLVMPTVGMIDEAIAIAEKGIEKSDSNWEIPYNLGMVYHMDKQDLKNAAKYFDLAANTPGAEENIKWIAANYASRPDIREQSKILWQGIAENTNDEVLRNRAYAYVYHYELLSFLEEMAKKHQELTGSYPDPIEQLVENKLLKEIPQDPFGYKFSIDSDGRARIKAN